MDSKSGEPTPLRKLLPCEQINSTLHNMGGYLSVTITCRYHSPRPGQKIDSAFLYPALGRVVSAQPMLHVGILNEHTTNASFCHIGEVNLANHVTFSTLDCETLVQYNDQIAIRHNWHHDQRWQNIVTHPPWRVAVVEPSAAVLGELSGVQDITFSFHHALMDGTSGRLFHELLLAELNNQLQQPQQKATKEGKITPLSSVLYFPEARQLPVIHATIRFTNSPAYFVKTLWKEFAPAMLCAKKIVPWHGKAIDFALPYITITKPVDIPDRILTKLIITCRQHQTTITGLLHALILTSLATRLSPTEASSFAAATPISLRPFLNPEMDPKLKEHLCNVVTGCIQEFPPDVVDKLRRPTQDQTLDDTIWRVAQRVKNELNIRTSTLPKDDVSGLFKYVSDWFEFFKKKDGKPRAETWEISNIGVFKDRTQQTLQGVVSPRYRVSRMYFSNGSMVTAAAVGIGVGSVPSGALTIAISWQKAVVADELMNGLAEDLLAYVRCFDKIGTFGGNSHASQPSSCMKL
ncbi:Alcohol acetyltransferase [Conoideocrella luteorostrata]|uniref:Alcohol acetyltransferase n=1 Tax=Conoideocrella luteorostrata TaxID=1105319 RepID=A0AAJ0CUF4_9HYPO|nr:Alcohol acetyltransferase [Conoideocrella luteorostrata]